MLKIQEFIRQFPSITEANYFLREKLSLDIKRFFLTHVDEEEGVCRDEVFVYNYHMIKSPVADPIVQEARGLILDKDGDIVSMSFPRFYNHNETYSAKLDWRGARAEVKYDGSLVTVYKYNEQWHIQTRGEATAQGRLPQTNIKFETAIKCSLKTITGNDNPFEAFEPWKSTHCYVFEFISPYNRIVTPYIKSELVLLSIIDKYCMQELDVEVIDEFADHYKFRRPRWYSVNSLEEVMFYVEDLGHLDEGFVVVDSEGKRIKVKNPSYIAVANTVNAGINLLPVHFAQMALHNKVDKIVKDFPEYNNLLKLYQDLLRDLIMELHEMWMDYGFLEDQKLFALKVKEHPLSGILFAKKAKRIENFSIEVYKIKPSTLVNISKKRMNERLEKEMNALIQKEASEYAQERNRSGVVRKRITS